MSFERNVFVNCPFDKRFLRLLRPLLFTIIYLKLIPRIALERTDSGESRLDTIVQLIAAPASMLETDRRTNSRSM